MDSRTSNGRVSKAIDDYGPWSIPQLALLVENVANCLDHGSSAEACAAELRGIAKHLRASHEPSAVIPDRVFDGYSVWTELQNDPQARQRTSHENVQDVLNAILRFKRATATKGEG